MSHKTVQSIVGRLVTDQEFRRHFLRAPLETLDTLRQQGYELTTAEVDALIRTDRALWEEAATRIDAQLQRVSLERH